MDHVQATEATRVLDLLRKFDPRIVGTLPLGLGVPGSDIDVICHVENTDEFREALLRGFSGWEALSIRNWSPERKVMIASFEAFGWPFEIFGAPQPTSLQAAWLHFEVERRLLRLGGEALRQAVLQQRRLGRKTEPAFAAVLGLAGDPYVGMLDLARLADGDLQALLSLAGFPVQLE
jgi:hypothetical protein